MFVIEVIPLIRGTKINTLSYFSGTSYAVGTFLTVRIRGKEQKAIVTEVHTVTDEKSNLRSAAFTLQKLPIQKSFFSVPENVRKTAETLTKIYPSSVGAILFQLLPPEVRNGKYEYPTVSTFVHAEETTPRIITAPAKDRFVSYRSHIRSVLARRGSVMFVAPTSTEVDFAYEALSPGIEDRMVVFSPSQSERERSSAYEAFEDTSIAKVILTTPSHAYLDRVDLLSIVIEGEASDYFASRTRPYLDHRTALINHAKTTGRSIMLGDILPRSEMEAKRREEIYTTEGEEIKRIAFSSPLSIVVQHDKPKPDVPFSLFSTDLKHRIEETVSGRGRVFLFGARRGISPVVTCIDCGHIFRCPDSGTPYSLMRTTTKSGKEERWFVSTTSGKRIRAADTCPDCGSWRLRERGIGIQSVYDECVDLFPDKKIILFDHLTASTKKRATALIKSYYDDRGTILIGTQMALPYLFKNGVDFSAVISLDATRANPTWKTDENVLRLLLQLREFSQKEVLVQTRIPADHVLSCATSGTIESFYDEELSLRQALNYPPFATFILLSWQGSPVAVEKVETEVKSRLKDFAGTYYSNPLSTESKILRHVLFRLPAKDPKTLEIINIIRTFPPYLKVEIDPNRIV
ncbi:MAG: hypothetical protein R3B53_04600 [Candidatus Paceibacterota bacterium]